MRKSGDLKKEELKVKGKLTQKDQETIKNYNENLDKAYETMKNAKTTSKINFLVLDKIKTKLGINMFEIANKIANKVILEVTYLGEKEGLNKDEVIIKAIDILNDHMTNTLSEDIGLEKQFEIAKILFPEANEVDLEDPDQLSLALSFVQKVNFEIMSLLTDAMGKKILGLKISDQEL